MNHLQLINQYLSEHGSIEGVPATGLPFVTISRQVAAGGHLLAHVVLTEFLREPDRELFEGWHVFDRELCEIVAADPSLEASMESLLSEERLTEFSEFFEGLFTGHLHQYSIDKKTFRIVHLLATLGKVIIVGRAGACVTRSLPGGVHVRLAAAESKRVRWMMKKLKLEHDAAVRVVREQDADKRGRVQEYFNKDIDDPVLYDVVWNSGTVNMEDIAQSVIALIKRRAETLAAASGGIAFR